MNSEGGGGSYSIQACVKLRAKKKEENNIGRFSFWCIHISHGVSGGGSLQDITSGYVSKRDCIILVLTSQLAWKYIDYDSYF